MTCSKGLDICCDKPLVSPIKGQRTKQHSKRKKQHCLRQQWTTGKQHKTRKRQQTQTDKQQTTLKQHCRSLPRCIRGKNIC